MTRTQTGYILAPDETDPHRTCKSKRFIDKIMFLCVVARPRWDTIRNQYFDGKIGMYPFIKVEKAKRASRNRPSGADVIKPVDVDQEMSRRMLIDKVLPDIRANFPKGWDGMGPERDIELQQDNATPHVNGDDEELAPEFVKDGIKIVLVNQPTNSPDMSVLDLGFFRAIQSLQHTLPQEGYGGIINATTKAFDLMSTDALNNVFLTWQSCMIEAIVTEGSNHYKIPHMGTATLQHMGELPHTLRCLTEIVRNAREFVEGNTPVHHH